MDGNSKYVGCRSRVFGSGNDWRGKICDGATHRPNGTCMKIDQESKQVLAVGRVEAVTAASIGQSAKSGSLR